MVPDITSPLKSKQQQLPLSNSSSTTSSPESSENIRYNTNNNNNNNHHRNSNSNNNFQNHYQSAQSTDSRLPIIKVKNQLIKRLSQHETLIIIGETGSGKTTQIPQFFFEIFSFKPQYSTNSIQNGDIKTSSFKGLIGITQPRRVAAVSLANRVANEIGTKIGDLVGYKIRFEESLSPRTKIKYMTDGILLREAITDPLLSNYRVIILDEVHERTVQIDVLLGIVKKAQRLRNKKRSLGDGSNLNNENSLKVVIMSATMDVDNFARYFDNAPVYYVEGRLFPIEIFYTEQKQNDYTAAALSTLFQIHQNEDELMITDKNSQQKKALSHGGDVLVFCTGQEEIESMIKVVNDLAPQINMMKSARGSIKTLKPYPLFSALPMTKQQQIFVRNANDCFRRVIFATNIAETSITIPNIRFVIDTGKFKSKVYSPKTGLEIMSVENISKTQACQRSGRAGRLASGDCYRLFTREEYKSLSSFPVPEIQKCNLSSVLLQMIASGITNIQEFDFIDPPSSDIIHASLNQLILMKAIEKFRENSAEPISSSLSSSRQYKLTRIGQLMVSFPVDPRFAILIIRAVKFGCTEEIITIISMLSVDNVFIMTNSERDVALAMHRKFASSEGDLIKLLKVFRKYKESKQSNSWCQENFLRPVQLKTAAEIRQQLIEICRSLNIPVQSCSNTEIVRKCLAIGAGVGIGLGSNVALLQRDGDYHTIQLNKSNNQVNVQQIVHIHPSSCLFSHSNKPECVLFVELVQTTKSYMRNLCLIDREWLMEQSFINNNNDNFNDNNNNDNNNDDENNGNL